MCYEESDKMKLFENIKRAFKGKEKEEVKAFNKGLQPYCYRQFSVWS